ncbi:MAG: VanZ family protein [Candidatus Latescibacteria bacterium]|nr:VanZ family protein [Candidatus Latescibacterota bacterium]
MVRFTSARERRLWYWVLAVLVAIYSTVGLAGTVAQALQGQGLLGVAFGLAFLVVAMAVAGIALHRRPKAVEVWVAIAVVTVYAMIIVRMGVGPVERTHLFEYGLLAVLIHQALLERRRNEASVRGPALLAIVTTALLGWGDEGLQAMLPNRVYDLRDVGINALAGVVATTASATLAWAARLHRDRRVPDASRESNHPSSPSS